MANNKRQMPNVNLYQAVVDPDLQIRGGGKEGGGGGGKDGGRGRSFRP